MSHIDSFQHEIVGLFGRLPVYHPLVDIDSEFKCTHKQLMIGGGSGEHPVLVLQNSLAAVAHFIQYAVEDLDQDNSIREKWDAIIDPYLTCPSDKVLKYYDWRIETYQAFAKLCKSKCLPNPYKRYRVPEGMWLEM